LIKTVIKVVIKYPSAGGTPAVMRIGVREAVTDQTISWRDVTVRMVIFHKAGGRPGVQEKESICNFIWDDIDSRYAKNG
jgi:hypothetical protein